MYLTGQRVTSHEQLVYCENPAQKKLEIETYAFAHQEKEGLNIMMRDT